MGAGGAERPVSHHGKAGRDAQRARAYRAGPAQYYSGPQTRPAGSVARSTEGFTG